MKRRWREGKSMIGYAKYKKERGAKEEKHRGKKAQRGRGGGRDRFKNCHKFL